MSDTQNKVEYCYALQGEGEGVVFRRNENKWCQSRDPVWKASVEYRFVPYGRLEGFFRKGVDEVVIYRDQLPNTPPKGATQTQRLVYTLLVQGGRLIHTEDRPKAVSGDQKLDYLLSMVGSGKNWTWVPQWAEGRYVALRDGRLVKKDGEFYPSHACGIFNWDNTQIAIAELTNGDLRFNCAGSIRLFDEQGKEYEVSVGDGLSVTREGFDSKGNKTVAKIYF